MSVSVIQQTQLDVVNFLFVVRLSKQLWSCIEMVSLPNHTFPLGKLDLAVNQHLVHIYPLIIPTQCFYRFFGDVDWSVGKIKLFLHFDKTSCVGIFDNCLDFTVLDCVDNNELYNKLYNFYQIKYS